MWYAARPTSTWTTPAICRRLPACMPESQSLHLSHHTQTLPEYMDYTRNIMELGRDRDKDEAEGRGIPPLGPRVRPTNKPRSFTSCTQSRYSGVRAAVVSLPFLHGCNTSCANLRSLRHQVRDLLPIFARRSLHDNRLLQH